jgi:hypothetical protein
MKSLKDSFPRLFLGVFVIIVFMACQAAQSKTEKQPAKKEPVAQAPVADTTKADTGKAPVTVKKKLIVYYFHGNYRCHSCTMIENLTTQAVESGFGDEIKSGRVEMKVINVETPGNEHFAEDYKLYTKSVILSDLKNGKETAWKNLDKVWTLLRDQGAFIDYIQKEIKTILQG